MGGLGAASRCFAWGATAGRMAWWEGGGEERRAYMCVCVYLGMRWCAELRTYIHTYIHTSCMCCMYVGGRGVDDGAVQPAYRSPSEMRGSCKTLCGSGMRLAYLLHSSHVQFLRLRLSEPSRCSRRGLTHPSTVNLPFLQQPPTRSLQRTSHLPPHQLLPTCQCLFSISPFPFPLLSRWLFFPTPLHWSQVVM